MKKELIKTQDYLLVVDDSSINYDDWVYDEVDALFFQYGVEHKKLNPSAKKVIAHLPFGICSTLEGVSLLPPLEIEDDVESMSFNPSLEYKKMYDDANTFDFRKGFVKGYNKAKEEYKFTEEDMINFACKVYNENYHKDNSFFTTAETLIKSFSQPKTPTHFDFEMESMTIDEIREQGKGFLHAPTFKIKTTTNSQGQTVDCGKYIY